MSISPCPPHEDLDAYRRSSLPTDRSEKVASHVLSCSRCQLVLQSLFQPIEPGQRTNVGYRTPQPRSSASAAAPTLAAPKIGLPEVPPTLAPGIMRMPTLSPEQVAASALHDLTPPKLPPLPFLQPAQGDGELGRLGGYRVLRLLGTGGMGMVFHAEDVVLGRQVALKVMKPDVSDAQEGWKRMLREARATAAIKHENLITVYQAGQEGDVIYLVMELLEGESLEERMRRTPQVDPAEVIRLGREMSAGLAAIHHNGLIHRDIKPSNIWLEAPNWRVKILDFGLARSTSGTNHSTLTQAGTVVGTPAFMAPEQARGDVLDARCDLFSMGCVLYHLATGTAPFKGDTLVAQLTSLAIDTPKPVRDINPHVPEPLANLIAQLLNKKPGDRPASAETVILQLNRIAQGTAGASASLPGTKKPAAPSLKLPAKKSPKPAQNDDNKSLRAAGLVMIVIAAVVMSWAIWGRQKPATNASNENKPPVAPLAKINEKPIEKPVEKPQPPVEKPPTIPPVVETERRPPPREVAEDRRPPRDRVREGPDNGPPPDDGPAGSKPSAEMILRVKNWVKPAAGAPERTYALEFEPTEMESVYFPPASGKKGKRSPQGPPNAFDFFSINGVDSPHAIGLHPLPGGPGYVSFPINKKFSTFHAIVAQNDGLPEAAASMVFSVFCDDKPVWTSKPLKSQAGAQECTVDVKGVNLLTLELKCQGSQPPRAAHGLWFEPYLEK